ncbi:MAG: hypothetical protein K2X28_07885 [Alphaproteobacteria bacterium]|jgi:hypothetical protein|nr:hypothetical protein [Alphaproteobacteria bacterium]
MPIKFYSTSNTGSSEGYNEINLGRGSLSVVDVALQGFYLSYGEKVDHNVLSIKTSLEDTSHREEAGDNIFRYKYICTMKDGSKNVSSANIRSLSISNIT